MDAIFQALLSWQFLMFCLMVFGIGYVIRTTVDFYIKRYKLDNTIWKELILPIMPLVLGSILGLVFSTYPYPQGLETTSGRFVFGMVSGLLSGLVYRVLKSFFGNNLRNYLSNKTGPNSNPTSTPNDQKPQ